MNEKGGSSKTTLVANLGAYLALARGHRVLGIDLDPQGQLGKVFGIDVHGEKRSAIDLLLDALLDDGALDRKRRTIALEAAQPGGTLPIVRTRLPNLDLIVANKTLGTFPSWEGGEEDATARLATALRNSPELAHYDFVLMDAPPSFGPLTVNVLRAADEVVVPVPLTYLALDGCAELTRTLASVRTRYGHTRLRISMVIPTFYRRTRLAHEVLERLKQRFPKEIAHTVVGFHVKIDEAQSHGLSIFEYAPGSRGAKAMAALAEELAARQMEGQESSP